MAGGTRRRREIAVRVAAGMMALTVVLAGCGSRADTDDPLIEPGSVLTVVPDTAPAETTEPSAPSTETTAPSDTAGGPTSAPPDTETAGAAASAGCGTGTDGLAVGEVTDEAIETDDGERTYQQFVPSTYDGSSPTPVVISLHGYTTGALLHSRLTALDEMAETEGFITITPDGVGPPSGLDDGNDVPIWNVMTSGDFPDDAGFVLSTLDSLEAALCIDLDRVYLVGLSNGGHFASQLVCEASYRIAGVATVGGLLANDGCNPSEAVPLVAFHGTDDIFVPFEGGEGTGIPTLNPPDELYDVLDASYEGADLAAVTSSAAAWAERNGCTGEPEVTEISGEVELRAWDCDAPVHLYIVEGGGGTWPGSALFQAIEAASGYTTTDVDANEAMWQFFTDNAG